MQWKSNVGSLMTEGKAASHSAAVEAHLVHQHEHGRNQDGDISDVNGEQLHNAVALSSVDGDIKGRHLKELFAH